MTPVGMPCLLAGDNVYTLDFVTYKYNDRLQSTLCHAAANRSQFRRLGGQIRPKLMNDVFDEHIVMHKS